MGYIANEVTVTATETEAFIQMHGLVELTHIQFECDTLATVKIQAALEWGVGIGEVAKEDLTYYDVEQPDGTVEVYPATGDTDPHLISLADTEVTYVGQFFKLVLSAAQSADMTVRLMGKRC